MSLVVLESPSNCEYSEDCANCNIATGSYTLSGGPGTWTWTGSGKVITVTCVSGAITMVKIDQSSPIVAQCFQWSSNYHDDIPAECGQELENEYDWINAPDNDCTLTVGCGTGGLVKVICSS
jgi:hypothetical protein